MKISFLTLFPEMFESFLHTSIIARAIKNGIVEAEVVDIRDYAGGSYRHVDDSPLGGGAGMVLKCQPVLDALNAISGETSYKMMMSPAGTAFSQKKAHDLAGKDHLVILCGHYEGIDYRVNRHMDELVSIGDYVLTGGELPAMVIADSVIRLLRGSIKEESAADESYENDLLEYPQYTQPADYNGDCVPEVLLSGHHERIRRWRLRQSLRLTRCKRPDLLAKHHFTEEESRFLAQIEAEDEWNAFCAGFAGKELLTVGGLETSAGRQVRYDVLFLGSDVSGYDAEQRELLAARGIGTAVRFDVTQTFIPAKETVTFPSFSDYEKTDQTLASFLFDQTEVSAFLSLLVKGKKPLYILKSQGNGWKIALILVCLVLEIEESSIRRLISSDELVEEILRLIRERYESPQAYLSQLMGISAKIRKKIRKNCLE